MLRGVMDLEQSATISIGRRNTNLEYATFLFHDPPAHLSTLLQAPGKCQPDQFSLQTVGAGNVILIDRKK